MSVIALFEQGDTAKLSDEQVPNLTHEPEVPELQSQAPDLVSLHVASRPRAYPCCQDYASNSVSSLNPLSSNPSIRDAMLFPTRIPLCCLPPHLAFKTRCFVVSWSAKRSHRKHNGRLDASRAGNTATWMSGWTIRITQLSQMDKVVPDASDFVIFTICLSCSLHRTPTLSFLGRVRSGSRFMMLVDRFATKPF